MLPDSEHDDGFTEIRVRTAAVSGADGDRRDRDAVARDSRADQRDRAAEERDRLDAVRDDAGTPTDVDTWRARARLARRASADDRSAAADDRAAAKADRVAAARDRQRSSVDSLTGAYRRDAGMVELAYDFDHARRSGQPMIIGFLDVDGLKAVNDRYGHAAGDDVLRRVAAAVHIHLDHGDILVRYGGDEFIFGVVGLGESAVRDRLALVESVLRADGAGTTISCGVAVATGAATVQEVIERADRELYQQRRNARRTGAFAAIPGENAPRSTDVAPKEHTAGFPFDERIGAILADLSSVQPVFQPIVDLADGVIVGYEALARWPFQAGVDPTAVFAAAAAGGVLAELDMFCRTAALDRAIDAGLTHSHTLFLNVEPDTARGFPDHAREHIRSAAAHMGIVLELTERSLLTDPAMLLTLVDQARADGCRIALDDVGSHPDSLTLLDFIAPNIIKLDRVLVQNDPTPTQVQIIAAISAYAESTGAVVLAEGIETPAHLDRGLAYGATLGQGWLYGHPAPLPEMGAPSRPAVDTRRTGSLTGVRHRQVPALPSDVFQHLAPTIGRKPLILALTRQIERYASHSEEALAILATFQQTQWFTPPVAQRYADLAANNPFVAVLGIDMPLQPATGVRGTDLDPEELFTQEWTVTVVGQHYFAAIIARDLGDTGDDDNRRFEFLHTYDRNTVVTAARSLMQRVVPARP